MNSRLSIVVDRKNNEIHFMYMVATTARLRKLLEGFAVNIT